MPSASAARFSPVPVQLVEPGGQPLGQAAGVHEDERRAVLLHQLQQPRVHGRPDRAARRARPRPGPDGRLVDHRAELGHVVDRDDDLDLEGLAHAGVDDRDRAGPPATSSPARCRRGTGRSPRAAAAWPTARCAGAAAPPPCRTQCSRRSRVTARWLPALGGGQRVDLVDDHRLDAAQRLARRRGEHQVQRLGGGDRGCPAGGARGGAARRPACRRCGCRPTAPCTARRVARPPAGCPGAGCAGSSRRPPPAPAAATRTRSACGACARSAAGVAREDVDAPQERGQRLARAGGRQDQRVLAAGDGRPALRLRRRRLRERGGEPRPAPPARTARADPARPRIKATDAP